MSLNYQKRFNIIYHNAYDLSSWTSFPVSIDILDYTKELLSKKNIDKKSSILDAGCGRGRLLVELENFGFVNITGVDISSVALKYAKKIIKKSIIIEGDFIHGISLPDSQFDLIIDSTMISSCHPDDWSKIFREFNRLLKSDGYLIFEMFSRPLSLLLRDPLIRKNEKIPDKLDPIFGITEEEVQTIFGKQFNVIHYKKSYPDSIGRYHILAKKI